MPVVVIVVIAAILLAYVALREAAHLASAHLVPFIGAGALVVALIIGVTLALIRGATHHTMISRPVIEQRRRPELPSPAEPMAIEPPKARPDPFSSDGKTWAELVAAAEREEALKRGNALPRAERALCEGPDCGEPLDEEPWVIEVRAGKGTWQHRFCSEECADEWEAQDKEARHAGSR